MDSWYLFVQENVIVEQTRPALVNAFELISMSHGLDLSGLFKEQKVRIPSSKLLYDKNELKSRYCQGMPLNCAFGTAVFDKE